MSSIEFEYKIRKLSKQFYETYPLQQFKEILDKTERAYNCIVLEVSDEYFICIPYRTEIKHKYAYHFKDSKRSQKHNSGLDYTKMIIIDNLEFIDSEPGIVDKDEYVETVKNIYKIKNEAFIFLNEYRNHITGRELLHESEFERRYKFSPLKYFHSELKLY